MLRDTSQQNPPHEIIERLTSHRKLKGIDAVVTLGGFDSLQYHRSARVTG
jgi:hypothetical protein